MQKACETYALKTCEYARKICIYKNVQHKCIAFITLSELV